MSSKVITKSRRRKRPRIRVVIPQHKTDFKRAGDVMIEELLRAAGKIKSPREQRTYLTRIIQVQKGMMIKKNK